MAAPNLLIITLLSFLIAFPSFISSHEGEIAVYWGQNKDEGSLVDACNSGTYKIVILAFLDNFGSGESPILNLGGHCDAFSGGCETLSEEISTCQDNGIKVLLSIGGPRGRYQISSPEDAKEVADYLWDNFLSGNGRGPLGNAALDGIDFFAQEPGSTKYWADLARDLSRYTRSNRKIYLSAGPQCRYPDRLLDPVIRTALLDYVWVRFYNKESCDYREGPHGLLQAWNMWSGAVPPRVKLFLGLLASPRAGLGFVSEDRLQSEILPVIKKSKNYGGVMLWNRFHDLQGYGQRISPAVVKSGATVLKLRSED